MQVQYSVRGIHVHSSTFNRIQLDSILAQRHSYALKHIQTCSIAFTLAQRHLRTLNLIQESVVKCIQSRLDSLKGVHAHSSTFNHVQCSLKHIQSCLVEFNWVQQHSLLAKMHSHTLQVIQWQLHSLKGIQFSQTTKGPMDMCLNMQSMRKPIDLLIMSIGYSSTFCDQKSFAKRQMTSNINIGKKFW